MGSAVSRTVRRCRADADHRRRSPPTRRVRPAGACLPAAGIHGPVRHGGGLRLGQVPTAPLRAPVGAIDAAAPPLLRWKRRSGLGVSAAGVGIVGGCRAAGCQPPITVRGHHRAEELAHACGSSRGGRRPRGAARSARTAPLGAGPRLRPVLPPIPFCSARRQRRSAWLRAADERFRRAAVYRGTQPGARE